MEAGTGEAGKQHPLARLTEEFDRWRAERVPGSRIPEALWDQACRPIACFGFSSAPRHIECRDRCIGWNQELRKTNLPYLAYNTRFLILPWVQVPHLASHLLGRIARSISADWQEVYHHPLYLLETFVDTERFAGTCYKAANWQYVGLTKGLGKNSRTGIPDRSIKAVWVYPLVRDFRSRMCQP